MSTMIGNMLALGASAALLAGCSSPGNSGGSIMREPFGTAPDGQPVEIFTLRNKNGIEARIMTYGGILVSLKTPDRSGALGDIVLGYDNLDSYVKNSPYFGALIGRYGNRIAKGHFSLDGSEYTLATNNYPNALHGGDKGFDKHVWTATVPTDTHNPMLILKYLSKDGEEGYPGNMEVTATYTLQPDNTLRLEYRATTDKDTVANLTEHSYFNLAGHGTILNHLVQIFANDYTPVDSTLIPTGQLAPVEGTPFDFRKPAAIGARIGEDNEQLKFGGGYDHNWVINKPFGEMGLMARVVDPESGRVLEISSTEPGLQFYSGNFLDGTITGKGGRVYEHRAAFCMEPQHYPDSPNHPDFPTTELKPGQVYHNTILYHFSVEH
jgi:aldose 1-epimerase